jgi:RNA polymerase sigma-70 factor (ECF subfamily)
MTDRELQLYTELLVIRSLQGDKDAFGLIVELWHKPLLNFALRYLNHPTDAGDVVQETWLAAIKGLNRIQSPRVFVSWLFRILTNKCIDRIREQKAQRQHTQRLIPKTDPQPISVETESLLQAIETLPEEHQTLIMLRFNQGLQVSQIAAILNLPEGTVKSRLHRALNHLRQILGDQS